MKLFRQFYTIGEELGKGAFGSVYIIKHKETGKLYAGKFIVIQKSRENEIKIFEKIKNIEKEIKILEKIKNIPNVVQYFECYEHVIHNRALNLVIVMEYIEGKNLKTFYECLKSHDKPISKNILLKFMLLMFNTLSKLHKKDIVHRDIKLANIIFNKKEIKFVDFGLSCITTTHIEELKCSKGRGVGTLMYLAPEIHKLPFYLKNTDMELLKAADVWSLGVTLYALANKKFHFMHKILYPLDEKLKSGPTPSSYPDNKINEIIDKCLTYDYKKRPTAKQLYKMVLL